MGALGSFTVRGRSGRIREVYTRVVSCFPVPVRSFELVRSQFPLGGGVVRDVCLIVVRFLAFKDVCALSVCSRGALELCSAHFEETVPVEFREQFSVVGQLLGLKLAFSVWNRSNCDVLNILKCYDYLFEALSSGDAALMEKKDACEDAIGYSQSYFSEAQLASSDSSEEEEAAIDVAGFLANRSGYTWCSLSFVHANKLLNVCKCALSERSMIGRAVQKTIGAIELMAFLHHALVSISSEGAKMLLETEPPESFIDFSIS
jgi:hypothetical protein